MCLFLSWLIVSAIFSQTLLMKSNKRQVKQSKCQVTSRERAKVK